MTRPKFFAPLAFTTRPKFFTTKIKSAQNTKHKKNCVLGTLKKKMDQVQILQRVQNFPPPLPDASTFFRPPLHDASKIFRPPGGAAPHLINNEPSLEK